MIAVAGLMNNIEGRGEMLELADQIWDHVVRRKLSDGVGSDLWDQPSQIYGSIGTSYDRPTWHHTLRVVESLVLAAELTNTPPLRSDRLVSVAHDLLAEAEHLFDKEQMPGTTDGRDIARADREAGRAWSGPDRSSRTAGQRGGRLQIVLGRTRGRPRPGRTPDGLPGRRAVFVFATSDKGGTGRSVTSANVMYRRALQASDVAYLDFDFGSPTAGAIFRSSRRSGGRPTADCTRT